jgi:peptidoglycan/LPS O-acetylase OafA/YrhL
MRDARSLGLGFGTWRLFLALCVAFSHLWTNMMGGPAAYAVWAFFVLSGFLMTHVLQHKYGFTPQGLRAYAYNRFLRIFPAFWVATAVGALVILWLERRGMNPRLLNAAFGLPRNREEWAFLVTLLPVFPRTNAPIPVANALSVEVGFYLLMPLLAAHRSSAWFALIFGVLINTNFGFDVSTFVDRYSLFLPAAPAFAAGSLVCHYRPRLGRLEAPAWSVTAWLLHTVIWFLWPYWPWTYGLYTATLLSAWVVLSLSGIRSSTADSVAGELSYPYYLLHTSVGGALLPWFGYGRRFSYALLGVMITLLASWLMVRAVDRPLTRWKRPAIVGRALVIPASTASAPTLT